MEKKEIKISLSSFFLIFALITIIVMGIFIYRLYNEKTEQTQKSSELENQVNNLNDSLNILQGKINTISTTINSNTSTENSATNSSTNDNITNDTLSSEQIKNIEGEFHPQINVANDASYFSFDIDGTVKLEGNTTMSGTYSIENNVIKIRYNKLEEPGMDDTTINKEQTLTIGNKNTLFDETTNITYKK